jgi:trimeric autotransporter adhesin
LRTDGNQIWTDMSVYDTTLVNNDIRDGKRWGIVLEISSVATVADNVISGNAFDGMIVANTDRVNIWNNTIVRNGRGTVSITQDSRRGPSADMSWVVRNISLGNNIYAAADTADAIWGVQSWERAFNASELAINSNGNVYSQTAVGRPAVTVLWAKKDAYATKYTSLTAFVAGTGQDKASYNLVGNFPVDSNFRPVSAVTSQETTVAQPLPSGVAAKVGKAAGTRHLGAWR